MQLVEGALLPPFDRSVDSVTCWAAGLYVAYKQLSVVEEKQSW